MFKINADNKKFLNEIPNSKISYKIKKELADYGSAHVYEIQLENNPKKYIMKDQQIRSTDENINNLLDSFRALKNLLISNCLYKNRFNCYEEIFIKNIDRKKYLAYIYEKIKGKDLYFLWKEIEDVKNIDFALLVMIAYQLFSSLDILHKNGISHRDIKPHNIIYNKDGTIQNFLKIIDFDFACGNEVECRGITGTQNFLAEDVLLDFPREGRNYIQTDIISSLITIIKLYLYVGKDIKRINFYKVVSKKHYINGDIIDARFMYVTKMRKNSPTIKIEKVLIGNLIDVLKMSVHKSPPHIFKETVCASNILDILDKGMEKCIPKEMKMMIMI